MFYRLFWRFRDLGKAASLRGWEVIAKNRPWKLFGHLVDILLFSQIKYSCQNFGLKFGGMFQIHLSASLVGLAGSDWQKSHWTSKYPEFRGFCPLGPLHKVSVNLIDHHCKGKVFTNIFYVESLFPTCLVYWMDATRFFSLGKKNFSPEITSQGRLPLCSIMNRKGHVKGSSRYWEIVINLLLSLDAKKVLFRQASHTQAVDLLVFL